MLDSKTMRAARRLDVELKWLLEDFSDIEEDFREILESEDFKAYVEFADEKFFYRVSFVGPVGFDNNEMAEKVSEYLKENIKKDIFKELCGFAINFHMEALL